MFDFFRKKSRELPQLFFHTDMHCHLIPGIDDGQRDAVSAAGLVAHQVKWGINRVFCTPHITQGSFENTPEIIAGAFGRLQQAVSDAGIAVSLDYSAEHRLDGFFQQQLEAGNIRPLPEGFLLVENSFVQEAWNLDQLLFDLQVKGFRPILAHPERYSYYYGDRARYDAIHNAGTLFQVNLLSLAGYYGKEEKRVAEFLIERGLVDFVATDMHHHRHCEAIEAYMSGRDFRRHAAALEGRLLNDSAF
ncbi:MAG: hypothetical protein K2L78_06040 [Muribaculaceae bacterium]|nr:hypothetical protein [Muribaculaceae bacterium]